MQHSRNLIHGQTVHQGVMTFLFVWLAFHHSHLHKRIDKSIKTIHNSWICTIACQKKNCKHKNILHQKSRKTLFNKNTK